MIIKNKETGAYSGIQCDAKGCETKAPSAKEIMQGHGLNNMGWRCSGGTHFCPDHATEEDIQ